MRPEKIQPPWSEWTWEQWLWRGTLHSPRLNDWSLTIRWFNVISGRSWGGILLIVILTTFRPINPWAFFRCFMSNLGAHIELQTEPFIWFMGADCFNSFNHCKVQVLSYSKYSLLFLPVVGIESATSRWFHSETHTHTHTHIMCMKDAELQYHEGHSKVLSLTNNWTFLLLQHIITTNKIRNIWIYFFLAW